jgi:antitoxin MazE
METVIRKWGNSPAIRIPASLMKAGQFELEQEVKITAEDGRIIIEPLHKVEYSLDELLAGITAENAHPEASFGSPMGKETL